MRIGNHDTHDLADAFPLMFGDDLKGMAESIKANGQLRPIDLYQDRILDGRNRYLGCIAAKVEPIFREFVGDDEAALQYVLAMNLDRRDLDADQRALVVRRIEKYRAKLCKAAKKSAKQAELPVVSDLSAERAETYEADAEPELKAAHERGDIPLHVAAEIAKEEPEVQRAQVKAIEKDLAKPAVTVRAKAANDNVESLAVQLSPVDFMALKSMMWNSDKSVHEEVKQGAKVLRRIVPGLGR
jgi:ParB-like chromosome segregation protein Spo0J